MRHSFVNEVVAEVLTHEIETTFVVGDFAFDAAEAASLISSAGEQF
jgi:hypothetical protein